MARGPTHPAATAAEPRLRQAGIALTWGGEPTNVPLRPEGAEWSVAADGPSKLGCAKALAAELQGRVWPQATLLCCSGKGNEGEVTPRWALRLFSASGGRGASAAAQHRPDPGLQPLELHDGEQWGALAWPRTAERRRQVLTLEQDRSGWGMFLPPLGRAPVEQLLGAIAAAGEPWSEPELSGVLPLDLDNAGR